MENITELEAFKIAKLALNHIISNEDLDERYNIVGGGGAIKSTNGYDIAASILVLPLVDDIWAYHINIMSNGDVLARSFDYRPKDIKIVAVRNQREISKLVLKNYQ